jgi:hypothetical protein
VIAAPDLDELRAELKKAAAEDPGPGRRTSHRRSWNDRRREATPARGSQSPQHQTPMTRRERNRLRDTSTTRPFR